MNSSISVHHIEDVITAPIQSKPTFAYTNSNFGLHLENHIFWAISYDTS